MLCLLYAQAQAGPIVLDLDTAIKFGTVLVVLAVAWGVQKAQQTAIQKSLTTFGKQIEEFVPALAAVQASASSATGLANEALRQATAAHSRVDKTDSDLRNLREKFIETKARHDERSRLIMELKATGRMKPVVEQDMFTEGDE